MVKKFFRFVIGLLSLVLLSPLMLLFVLIFILSIPLYILVFLVTISFGLHDKNDKVCDKEIDKMILENSNNKELN